MMQQAAILWHVSLLVAPERRGLALGIVGLVRVGPIVVCSLLSGVAADALDRRRLLMATQTAATLVAGTLAALTFSGLHQVWPVYLLAALGAAASAFDGPARQALLPLLVPREDLPAALGMLAVVWQVAAIGGPALGGVVLAAAGVLPIYLLDAVSFLAVLVALATMRHREEKRAATVVGWDALLDGVRFLRTAPVIRSTMLLDFVATFFGGSMLLMPIFADQILTVGPRGLGVLYAAQPVGAALAGLFLSSAGVPRRQGRAILISVAFYGLAIAVFGASRWFPLSLVALAASGAADTISMVIRQTLRQLLTPDALRGRMTSINMIFFVGGPQLGEVEAGAVARAFGARVSVASGGLLCVAAVALTALLSPSLRRYRG
jgi:MFS family permease